MFSRFTHGRVLNLLQKHAAKVHFNEIALPKTEFIELIGNKDVKFEDEGSLVRFRYGIIGDNDMIRDLQYWETLMVSSMMQRPI